MKTIVLNMLGGSGLGKTTTAALTFGELKLLGKSAEYVQEFVKTWAWVGRKIGPTDQGVIYGNQLDRESVLYNRVEFIVTDSPLVLSAVYQKFYTGKDDMSQLITRDLQTAKERNVHHINLLLKRHKAYDPNGRYETEDQAKAVDVAVETYLKEKQMSYVVVTEGDRERVQRIVSIALMASGISHG